MSPESAGPPPTPESHPIQTVLVVDDERDILDSMRTFLEGAIRDIRVKTASSGPDALDYLANNSVDLIMADYRMPGMDGLAFLAKARESRSRVPRILMTAYPDLELAVDAINDEDVERFFTKPLDPLQVVDTVQEILGEQRTEAMRKQAYAKALNLLRQKKGAGGPSEEPAEA